LQARDWEPDRVPVKPVLAMCMPLEMEMFFARLTTAGNNDRVELGPVSKQTSNDKVLPTGRKTDLLSRIDLLVLNNARASPIGPKA
jgi:hypothetical protein